MGEHILSVFGYAAAHVLLTLPEEARGTRKPTQTVAPVAGSGGGGGGGAVRVTTSATTTTTNSSSAVAEVAVDPNNYRLCTT